MLTIVLLAHFVSLLLIVVEVQHTLLASLTPAEIRSVAMVQRWFRRWRAKKQVLIRAKIRSNRATMDQDMMARLASGKRRTMEASAGSALLAAAAAAGAGRGSAAGVHVRPGALFPASTTPSTPTANRSQDASRRHSPLSGASATATAAAALLGSGGSNGGGLLSPEDEAARAAKKRASIQRMLSIQARFNAEGGDAGKVEAAPDSGVSAAAVATAEAVASAAAIAASTAAAAAALAAAAIDEASGSESARRGGVRLSTRRRTFNEEQQQQNDDHGANSIASPAPASLTSAVASAVSSSSSSSAKAAASRNGNGNGNSNSSGNSSEAAATAAAATALQHLRFVRLVVRLQQRFRKHRAELRLRLAAKLAAQQRRQTMDADRKLRRASMPHADLSAVRKRLSNGPAPAKD